MKSPKISVIMPTYNTLPQYFKPAVESILKQTYKNLELLIVDDGSSFGNIKNIINQYNDNRILYINEGHHGAGAARNIGINYSTGEYIYVMASDDVLDKEALAKSFNLIKVYNCDIALFNLYGQDNDGKITVLEAPVTFNITNPGDTTQLVKKDLIIKNNLLYENFTSCNDLTFTYSILALAKRVVKINRCFYHYNTNVPNQISATRGSKSINCIKAFCALKNNLKRYNLFYVYKKVFYKCFCDCMAYEISKIRDEQHYKELIVYLKQYKDMYRKYFSYKYTLIGKQRIKDKRIIYFLGIKIFSYIKYFDINLNIFDLDIRKRKAFPYVKNNICNIVLGSSTARDGWVPSKKDFNFGMSSQDLYHSYNLYKWCVSQGVPKLKKVILFFDVFSPGLQLEKTQEAYKSIIYKQLFNVECAFKIDNKYKNFIKKLTKYIQYKHVKSVSGYYGKSEYNTFDNVVDIQSLVELHLKNNMRNNNNIDYIDEIYNAINHNKQKLYIVIPPYRYDYLDCLPDKGSLFYKLYLKCKYKNIKILDFLCDTRFSKEDFSDSHHLNKKGASKLTSLINQMIN